MTVSQKIAIYLVAGIVGLAGLELGERLSISGISSVVSTAQATVGRPLTPVSVAGVSRRTSRRQGRR